ncbi:cryptochrome/photolyase family protein [Algibacter lectus]|uniref:Deoxyribodipyrimidine photo-lyase n=1 Tax=Algibacter lectus TaxID=221126 RepID=A0A4R8MDN3_9FLAO|nr:deoxyribodipyrimidine photo-lyase [Algibacter lectus]MWW23960.1 deoxyribodipyrimidine photo-lyase [Algibacter lectus]TDY61975.1 deoxyribodipyrimidine photo-lyase [Algibacter lectus]
MENKITLFWFRRDLRLEDNTALHYALKSSNNVLPIFIFDDDILDSLPKDDARVSFIHNTLENINKELTEFRSSLVVKKGSTLVVWKALIEEHNIERVFFNKDYEPYAIKRDLEISKLLKSKGIETKSFKDQVIFEENDILKNDNTPYTIYTPFKNKWLKKFDEKADVLNYEIDNTRFHKINLTFPSLEDIGFTKSKILVKPYNLTALDRYDEVRNFPAQDQTSYLSPHLRFGLVSTRNMVKLALKTNAIFLSELIWREFFMQILFHFPKVVTENFKQKYDAIPWRNNEADFKAWCEGRTGYPMVDAGMRELNKTGYMHNRVRMITAGFLCKHLLIDWRWGEAYFAEKLLDYELSANNGNWQWAAGTGCDAAPYFRVFNPAEQLKKFDKDAIYIRRWVEDYDELTYPQPMVEHKFARERAISTYKKALNP